MFHFSVNKVTTLFFFLKNSDQHGYKGNQNKKQFIKPSMILQMSIVSTMADKKKGREFKRIKEVIISIKTLELCL